MPSHPQRVINYYDATHIDYRILWSGSDARAVHFGYYDTQHKNHYEALLRMNEVLAESVKINSTDNVLDSGCGYGGSAMWLATKYGCNVTGVTLSPLQAKKGRRYVQERDLELKVQIQEGDYANLFFSNKEFDVYWALESLVHAENREKVLAEAARVLKENGRIVIAEYTLRENPPLSEMDKQYLQPWLDGWAMPRLLTPTEFRKILTESGFVNIEIKNVTESVKPSLKRLEILSIINYPIALLIGPLFFRRERLENYYASWRQINALKKGLWEYSIITARKS